VNITDKENRASADGLPEPIAGAPIEATARRLGPSRRLVGVAVLGFVVIAVLSVVLARRDDNASSLSNANQAQFALTSAVQAAGRVYGSNNQTFPIGHALLEKLDTTDPELLFAFGPQYLVQSSSGTNQYPISVATSSNGQVILFATPGSGRTCWYATDNFETPGVVSGLTGASPSAGLSYSEAANQQVCNAGAGLPTRATPWGAKWPAT
jgi:hypothetical protein